MSAHVDEEKRSRSYEIFFVHCDSVDSRFGCKCQQIKALILFVKAYIVHFTSCPLCECTIFYGCDCILSDMAVGALGSGAINQSWFFCLFAVCCF